MDTLVSGPKKLVVDPSAYKLWIHINVCHICHKGASVLIYMKSEKSMFV